MHNVTDRRYYDHNGHTNFKPCIAHESNTIEQRINIDACDDIFYDVTLYNARPSHYKKCAEQSRAEQNRTEQNRTEQNRTEQNRTEQNRTEQII